MPLRRFAILLSVCCLAFTGNFIQYQASALALDIMPMLEINSVGFSTMFLVPMLAAVFFGIPFGLAGDKFGPKRVVATCFAIACIGGLLRIITLYSYPLQLASLFLIGIGMAALSTNVVKTIALWFGSKTDTAVGVYYAVSCLGIVASQAVGELYDSVRQAYVIAEIALVAVTALWVIVDKNLPNGVNPPSEKPALNTFLVAAKNTIALAVGFSLSSSTAFAGLLPQALESGKGMSGFAAGNMAASVTIASIFGCIAGPALCAHLKSFKPYLMIINIVASAAMLSVWYVEGNASLHFTLAASGFISAMTGPILQAMPVMMRGIGSRFAGSASGIIGTVSLAMSFLLPILISALPNENYEIDLIMQAACFATSILPIAMLSKIEKEQPA